MTTGVISRTHSTPLELIVGIGNPGNEYADTRHNAGVWFVDELAHRRGGSFKAEKKFYGRVTSLTIDDREVRLLIPETYMNESGKSVSALVKFFKILPEAILVAHDEIDFPANIHGMKYHFIQTLKNPLSMMMDTPKDRDFAYWGRMKPSEKNQREKTIRALYRDPDISTVLVGGFPSGVKRDAKWIKEWKVLYPMIERAKCTLCFNWLDPTATTSRYPEAMSVGLVPFVWGDYDINNTYNIDDWQRVSTFKDLREKILSLDETQLNDIRNNYTKILPSQDEYYEMFRKMMDECL